MKLIDAIVDELTRTRPIEKSVREVLLRHLCPVPALRDSEPVILYFRTAADREDFVRTVCEAKPDLEVIEL